MVIALITAGAFGAGYAAYDHGLGIAAIIAFTFAGAAAGYLLSRLRHWEDL